MIRFACSCGHRFEVHDDLGGASIQCPKCGLLTDVPTLSDLGSFTDEGTYRMEDGRPVVDDADRLADLGIIYAKTKQDAAGNEIDLRTLPAGSRLGTEAAGDDAGDDLGEFGELELQTPATPDPTERPKYDPETGELIRPLDVRKDPERDVNPAFIPMATAALSYASAGLARRLNPLRLITELFMPMNLVVMFFIVVMHVLNGVLFIASVGLFFLWPVLLMYEALILAHYGNVIDDTGRNDQDDLPRPLRDLSFYDDMWSPFVQMAGALMIAYVIPILALCAAADRADLPVWMAVLVGWGIGALLAPALLITTNLSGSTYNLRPDRVLSVMRTCGLHYLAVALLGAVALPIYLFGWAGFCLSLLRSFLGSRQVIGGGPFVEWLLVGPALLVGVYLMHYFCWYLGLLYKAHHERFPWVLQRFIRDPAKNRPGSTHADQLSRPRAMPGHLLPPAPTSTRTQSR